MLRFGSVLFPGHGTHAGGSEVAVGRNWVWSISTQSADEPALVAMSNRQPGRDRHGGRRRPMGKHLKEAFPSSQPLSHLPEGKQLSLLPLHCTSPQSIDTDRL